MGSFILGPDNLQTFTSKAKKYTDDRPILEYKTALKQTYSASQKNSIITSLKAFQENPLKYQTMHVVRLHN